MSNTNRSDSVVSRRRVFTLVSALVLASTTLLPPTRLFAGGTSENVSDATDEPASADNRGALTLDVGYMPILPVAQAFVMAGEGWPEDAGIAFNMIRFQNGPAMVQAVAGGKLDVMFFGIGPALVARGRGEPIRVVAANVVEQIAFIAGERLAAVHDPDRPERLFADFAEAEGRTARIATFPEGSVPYTVLTFWLSERLGVDRSEVEIVPMGADQVQQALLAGRVDGASILEPTLTIVERRAPSTRVLARADEMFPQQPGAVLAVRQSLVDESPEVVEQLVAMHIRATEILRNDVDRATDHVSAFIGSGLVDRETMRAALTSPSTTFIADPRLIREPTQRMHDFQRAQGTLTRSVNLDELFADEFFEAVQGQAE